MLTPKPSNERIHHHHHHHQTPWHPIHTTASEDLWELPSHRSRTLTEDELFPNQDNNNHQDLMFNWFPLENNASQTEHRREGSDDQSKKRQALGDATNTAPVLRAVRSRFV